MPSAMQWWIFVDQRPATALEPLDHPRLPQWAVPVELLGHEPAHQRAELAVAPRRRQRGMAQVVLELEVRIVDPDRPAELQRHEPHDAGGSAGRLRASPGSPPPHVRRPATGPSNTAHDAMCMCVVPSSMKRKNASSGLRRSTSAPPRADPIPSGAGGGPPRGRRRGRAPPRNRRGGTRRARRGRARPRCRS